MIPKTYTFTVVSNAEIAPEVYLLIVKPNEKAPFYAGQYFSFKIADKVNRSYSIASAPNDENIEFLVELIPNGVGSTFVKNLKVGDSFDALGSLGFLTLEKFNIQDLETPLIFIGTGTGIVPLRSMIRHLLLEKKSTRKIDLYFGLRFDNHAYWFEEFAKLASSHSNFTFTPVISKPTENWGGEVGHCQDLLLKKPVDSSADIYLCGSNRSVDGISSDLIAAGYQKEKIHFEKFG